MDLRLLIPFRRDAKLAQMATPERRRIFYVLFIGYFVALVLSFTILPGPWVWFVLVGVFLTLTILGNYWAKADAAGDTRR
ncbi:hypothetical protein GY21_06395 [Cryobacterium roopkundense]|uniref:2TM domain-containing protein n=2 Tax=Cryobacterium roopkundense TaxID=1001240 RepID=A0A099JLF3_9MICO|nr:hypothetical protein GY21_06395 [Cryobacterium roopkundense]